MLMLRKAAKSGREKRGQARFFQTAEKIEPVPVFRFVKALFT